MSTKVEIREFLTGVSEFGLDWFTDERIEKLEGFISECNQHHNAKEAGESIVPDVVYDRLVELLRRVKPDSQFLTQLWEEDGDISEYTYYLQKEPMMSINTVKDLGSDEYYTFVDNIKSLGGSVELFFSYKIDGHGIRVVYNRGKLVSATSRARNSAGRDLTQQMKWVLGEENTALSQFGLVEVRGELCLPLDKLDKAREYNPAIKSAFSGVSSLVRPSTTEEEAKLLDFLAYRFISDDKHFNTKKEEYLYLQECGFDGPNYGTVSIDVSKSAENIALVLGKVVESFEESYENFGYFCDGVVVEVNDKGKYASLGDDGHGSNASMAMKVGIWGQTVYEGFVKEIEWTKGKSKLSPVAIVCEDLELGEGVLTSSGNTVSRVPLYEPCNVLMLKAYPGELLKFHYGGEAGVVPLTRSGKLIKDALVNDLFDN